MRCGELASALLELERQQGFHLSHPHGSCCEKQHLNLAEVARNRGLIDEAVGAALTDGVEDRNSS
jgi:hypothetical protein